jgi:hypothetical protein
MQLSRDQMLCMWANPPLFLFSILRKCLSETFSVVDPTDDSLASRVGFFFARMLFMHLYFAIFFKFNYMMPTLMIDDRKEHHSDIGMMTRTDELLKWISVHFLLVT